MTKDTTEKGLEVFGQLMGEEAAAQMKAGITGGGFGSAIAQLATDYAFGTVWAREEGLERKERSLVVISLLIAQRQILELKNHIRIGLTNGLTPSQIEEVLLQAIPYVGFPAVSSVMSGVIEVFRERGIDTTSKTSEERGLL